MLTISEGILASVTNLFQQLITVDIALAVPVLAVEPGVPVASYKYT
jgi:hypothetical protein